MKKKTSYMTISELSKHADTPVSKIRYYISREMIPRPIKTAQTSGYYTDHHLKKLNMIRELQNKNMAASEIKKIIDCFSDTQDSEQDKGQENTIVKQKIIEASISVFRKKGFERATITDLSESAGIGRNTFYQYFKNKKELFAACIEEVLDMTMKPRLAVNKNDSSFTLKMRTAFYEQYPLWSDLINLLRAQAVKYPEEYSDVLEKYMRQRVDPIIEDYEELDQIEKFRNIDTKVLAVMIAGALEYLFYFFEKGFFGDQQINEISKALDEILYPLFQGDPNGE